MNMKLTNGLLGLGALLIAGQVSAATVSLTPFVTNVAVDDVFSLTVQGTGFDTGVTAGTVHLEWDTTAMTMTSSDTDIRISLLLNGFTTDVGFDSSVQGQLDVVYAVGFLDPALLGPSFDYFSLDFVAIPPPSQSSLGIAAVAGSGTWQDADGFSYAAVDYIGAQVNVSAVPVPAAVWLFGSGLIGLVGIARRKTQLA